MWTGVRRLGVIVAACLAVAPGALAQSPEPVELIGEGLDQTLTDTSCRLLVGGTATIPEERLRPDVPDLAYPSLPPAPAAAGLPDAVHFRSLGETFNRRWAFAVRDGRLYIAAHDGRGRLNGPWRQSPVPACIDGRIAAVSADDDELVAIDERRRIYTMDHALDSPTSFNWTSRWGPPFWAGAGHALADDLRDWELSVISPREDVTWPDPAGNPQSVGDGKVTTIFTLSRGGTRLTYYDPWLPNDHSYEVCGPYGGRFRARSIAASGSTIVLLGRHGDVFTRLYDFDMSGGDNVFFRYSYEDQRGKPIPAVPLPRGVVTGTPELDGPPIQLPAVDWVAQGKPPGRITDSVSVFKVGRGSIHRTVRVEGMRGRRTGYWEKHIGADASWRFVETGEPLQGHALRRRRGDTSRRGLAEAPGMEGFAATLPGGAGARVVRFDPHCSPSELVVEAGGATIGLRLHAVDGLRQRERATELDTEPRRMNAAIEVPQRVLDDAASLPAPLRELIAGPLGGRRFTEDRLRATDGALALERLGWTLRR